MALFRALITTVQKLTPIYADYGLAFPLPFLSYNVRAEGIHLKTSTQLTPSNYLLRLLL